MELEEQRRVALRNLSLDWEQEQQQQRSNRSSYANLVSVKKGGGAPWYREKFRPAMPLDVWKGLSDHAQRVSRSHVALDGEAEFGVHDDLGRATA